MRLIGRAKLEALAERDREAAKWVANWVTELREANWMRAADVGKRFPKALQQADGTILFPVPRQGLGIQVLMAFPEKVALITRVKSLDVENGN